MKEGMHVPRRLSRESQRKGEWLELDIITYLDQDGRRRQWEAARRCRDQEAVLIIPRFKESGCYVLVEQYRPATDCPMLEFPAGLRESDENPGRTAERELYEETGYRAEVIGESIEAWNSPALVGEKVWLVPAVIDETAPENANPKPMPDEGEHVIVHLISPAGIWTKLADLREKGVGLDNKALCFFLGRSMHHGC